MIEVPPRRSGSSKSSSATSSPMPGAGEDRADAGGRAHSARTADIVVGSPAHTLRRTSIATAGAVLLALCLALLGPLGAAKAFAINDQSDIKWDISKGRSGYQQMIKDVRSRIEQKVIYGTSSETVWATEASTDCFTVNVYDGSKELIRLVMNAHNAYVQGNPAANTVGLRFGR
ncbi:hypothetical protein [Streptomyces sp. NPDC002491]